MDTLLTKRNIIIAVVVIAVIAVFALSGGKSSKAPAPAAKPAVTAPVKK
jgi:FlaG/FlaF family flagellin (archaellin)